MQTVNMRECSFERSGDNTFMLKGLDEYNRQVSFTLGGRLADYVHQQLRERKNDFSVVYHPHSNNVESVVSMRHS